MKKKIFSCSIVLACLAVLTSSSPCTTHYVSSCNYVVKCEKNVAAVSIPVCTDEPYVTFIITNSSLGNLRQNFFRATNFDSKVREIKGVDNSWSKIGRFTFAYYSKCLRLDLSNNSIEEIDANAFVYLSKLQFLNLTGNNIALFDTKSFFISDSVNNLQELDVSNNRLQILGNELNELPNLTKLYLQNNRLSSIADDAFFNLTNLKYLYLQHNLLTSVNSSLINLKSLTTLDLSNNRLHLIAGYEINCLVALVNFNISHNELTYVPSNYFRQAFDLEKVDFSFNQISTTIKDTMFINNSKLNFLDFKNNRIKKIQGDTFQYCYLSYLNLENNDISDDINDKTLSNLRNITKLDLSKQSVSALKNYAFNDMESLLYLNLSKNKINIVDRSSFTRSPITVLDLSHNKIPDLHFLQNCLTSLTELYLNNNNITVISTYIFHNKTQMRILDLSMNNIIKIEEYALPLPNLKLLNLSANYISRLRYDSVKDLSKMEILDLSKNHFSRLDIKAFANFNELRIFSIDSNHIRNFKTYTFLQSDLKKLRILCLVRYFITCYDVVHEIRLGYTTRHSLIEHDSNDIAKIIESMNITSIVGVTPPYIATDILNITEINANTIDPGDSISIFSSSKPQITTDKEGNLSENELQAIREEFVELKSRLANFTNAIDSFDKKINRLNDDHTFKFKNSSFKRYLKEKNYNNNVRIVSIPEGEEKGFVHIELSVDTKLDLKSTAD